ncbi:hypothetical protein [Flavobacterium sp.]
MSEKPIAEQIADLERKIAACRDLAGYAERVKAMQAKLAELQA